LLECPPHQIRKPLRFWLSIFELSAVQWERDLNLMFYDFWEFGYLFLNLRP